APSVNANFFDMMFALLMVFRLNAAPANHRPARVRLGAADKTRALKRRFLVGGLRGGEEASIDAAKQGGRRALAQGNCCSYPLKEVASARLFPRGLTGGSKGEGERGVAKNRKTTPPYVAGDGCLATKCSFEVAGVAA
ncbi:MAG: hypothetical protein ACJ8IR_11220, partial [Alphaproteobacteria bacterium]